MRFATCFAGFDIGSLYIDCADTKLFVTEEAFIVTGHVVLR